MKHKIDIFCDLEFWRSFMDSCAINYSFSALNNNWKEIESKNYLYAHLIDYICIHLKCSEKELYEELEREAKSYDEPMRLLEKKLIEKDGGNLDILDCSFDYYNGDFPSIGPNAVYFTNDLRTRSIIESKGILVVSLNEILSSQYCLGTPILISKRQWTDWNTILKQARHICNSLIICDSYVLKNLEKNLYPILDTLIPDCIDEVFKLTIITSEDSNCRMGEQLQRSHDEINKHLQQSKKSTRIELSIVRADKSQQHDRRILSNNAFIECPGGFDLLDRTGKSTKQTTIWYSFPRFANPRDLDTFFDVIETARRITESNLVIPENGGARTNRLFD